MPSTSKHVVSIGLGSSQRDTRLEVRLLGQDIIIERRGTDGDMRQAAALFEELDGKVDAFGLGGTDLFFRLAGRDYYQQDSLRLVRHAKKTPVVCGAGLKDSLERLVVQELDASLHFAGKKVLMVVAVDRFGMAETLAALGADMIYGDIIFALGLPLALRTSGQLKLLGRWLLPVTTRLPIQWLAPTGKNQERSVSGWRERYYRWADVIAGDYHFIMRFAPQDLRGKIMLTNTTTSENVALLQQRGLKTLITTTPRINGRSLSTNMLEAAFVALAGKYPLSVADYTELIRRAGIRPDIQVLNP